MKNPTFLNWQQLKKSFLSIHIFHFISFSVWQIFFPAQSCDFLKEFFHKINIKKIGGQIFLLELMNYTIFGQFKLEKVFLIFCVENIYSSVARLWPPPAGQKIEIQNVFFSAPEVEFESLRGKDHNKPKHSVNFKKILMKWYKKRHI